MNKPVSQLSNEDLISRFIEIGIAQGRASSTFDTARFSRLFDRKIKVVNELRRRPGDQRRLLLALYMHEDLQVRLNAVRSTYAFDPDRAQAVFREVKESNRQPWSGDAGMSLATLEMGLSQLPNDPWIPETRKERLALHEAKLKQTRAGIHE